MESALEHLLHNAEWYQAMTLQERMTAQNAVKGHLPKIAINADLALRRMNRWKSQPPFDNDAYFAQ